jgi:predicted ATPase/class 3 adenylate cyclase/DNA-binding CsgD family transcriptional regulator
MRQLPTGTVTLLFTDIEGSTYLLQRLGERYPDVLAECRGLLRAAFHQHHGYEVDTQGDAFFVAFERAIDAVSAAITTQRVLASHSWPEGVALRVRMGLHTGEPSVATEGYLGLDVHRAARIMSAGHGGQVLLSQTTRDLVEHALPEGAYLKDLGAHRLKDLQQPSHLFQLVMAGLPIDFPPLRTLDIQPNNLPIQPTRFLGREKEVAAVTALLCREDVRLVTLTGAGGAGKTRMALQVAAELSEAFPDGVFFVNLAPISDPELVIPTITQVLDVKEMGEHSLLDLLKAFLREKPLLLLLDNFEQVVRAVVQVAELLATCPRLRVLVTSRVALHVRAEHEFALPPLALPDLKRLPGLVALSQYEGVALFIQRAQAARPEFQLTNANAAAVAEICVRLDGLPLAIELAAARIKVLPPQALLARLGQRLAVLTGGARDVPVRQQTLRNTITWSYSLLGAAEQQLFRRLSVFVGGWTLEAAEALYAALDGESNDGAGALFDRMTSLLDNSLLYRLDSEGKEPRFALLETIREYAIEALAASQELNIAQEAHARYYLHLVEAELEREEGWQREELEQLEQEHDNLRAALRSTLQQAEERHDSAMALRLGSVLTPFWLMCGYWSEGRAFLERALTKHEGVGGLVLAKALVAAGKLAFQQGDYERAEMRVGESLALFREIGDTSGSAPALEIRGMLAWNRGNLSSAQALLQEALALYKQTNDKSAMVNSLFGLAWLARSQGEYTRARVLCEESLTLSSDFGDTRGAADAQLLMAQLLFDTQAAPTIVRSQLEDALVLYRQVDDKEGIAACFHLFGQIALLQGETEEARSWFEHSVALHKELGHQAGLAWAVSGLARVAFAQSDYVAARNRYEESLARARAMDDQELLVSCVEGLAVVVSVQGEPMWAARLWGAAEVLRETIGEPLSPVEHAFYERAIMDARRRLGERAFAAVWAEGRSMTPDQALQAQLRLPALSASPSTSVTGKMPIAYPAGLTVREVEVLRLVAKGMTDAQIAETLVISPRTVNTHLTSIYGKIGVSSRSEATRYALEQRLV